MSFSIGPSSAGMGPRSALDSFGNTNAKGGEVFNPKVVSRMLAYLKPYGWKMIAALILTLAESGLTLLAPYLTKIAIDDYIIPGDLGGLSNLSLIIGLAYICIFFVSSVSATCSPGLVSRYWQNCVPTFSDTCKDCTLDITKSTSPV